MKKGLCEIIAVIDRSGSMQSIVDDAIGGFNRFLREQKAHPGEARFTLIQFNHKYQVVHAGVPISVIPEYDRSTYIPEGMTALNDAVGVAITNAGDRFAGMDENERPEKVIVMIITDGHENSSVEHSLEKVKAMVERQQNEYNWSFVFVGVGIDGFGASAQLGIDPAHVTSVAHDSCGTQEGYTYTSGGISKMRSDIT